jgi:selenide,water dikinase
VLRHFADLAADRPDLLVGLAAPDDAAVYRLNDEQAAVMTVDFFAPLVDDPYDYGAIASANAMSDVWAMGGEVLLALNIAAFPDNLPAETIATILRGGADKVAEAGGVLAGGHTIRDDEPKYGMCVLGLVHPGRVLTKGGTEPGDVLFLTKPVGTGIVTTAAMQDAASPEHLSAAVESMKVLNRHASHIAREVGVSALTDVTGYSLLGHAYEMAAASGARLRIVSEAVPLLPGAIQYARQGFLTGGGERNRSYFSPNVTIDGVSEEMQHVLWDAQTSGGLLMTMGSEGAKGLETRFRQSGLPVWAIGEVVEGEGVEVTGRN